MVVTTEGLTKIRDLLNTNITQGDWGTGTARELPSDTGLQSEIAGIEQTTTNSVTDQSLQVTAVLPSTAGTGNTISEYVVRFSSGNELSRVTFAGISKTTSKELHCISTFVITSPTP